MCNNTNHGQLYNHYFASNYYHHYYAYDNRQVSTTVTASTSSSNKFWQPWRNEDDDDDDVQEDYGGRGGAYADGDTNIVYVNPVNSVVDHGGLGYNIVYGSPQAHYPYDGMLGIFIILIYLL